MYKALSRDRSLLTLNLPIKVILLKALVNIVFDRLKKSKTVLADLYNYVHVGE